MIEFGLESRFDKGIRVCYLDCNRTIKSSQVNESGSAWDCV